MLDTSNPVVLAADVAAIQKRLYAAADRLVQADHASGAVRVNYSQLALLVAEILAEHTAAVRQQRAALWTLLKDRVRTVILVCRHNSELHRENADLHRDNARLRTGLREALRYGPDPLTDYPGDERALADLRDLATEARVRENDVISLVGEVEKLQRALEEAARDSESAARFVTTMLGVA